MKIAFLFHHLLVILAKMPVKGHCPFTGFFANSFPLPF